jgi:hypothetical protein
MRTMNYIPWQQNKGARVRTAVYLGAVSDHHFTGISDIQLVTARTARTHTHTQLVIIHSQATKHKFRLPAQSFRVLCTRNFFSGMQENWTSVRHFDMKIAIIQTSDKTENKGSTYKIHNGISLFLIIKPTRCTNFSNLFWKWNSTCFWSCSKAVYKPVWHITLLSVQWITSWWWKEELSETCRVSFPKQIWEISHLVGFITRKFVTMHGHMLRCTVTWTEYLYSLNILSQMFTHIIITVLQKN